MTELYLAWQHPPTRQWFPVGRLVRHQPRSDGFEFAYVRGAKEAEDLAGFRPIPEFPSLERRYRAPDLFPTFRNRVINTSRSDRQVYLSHLGLDAVTCDELAELSVSGGHSHSDSYEIFPAIEPDLEGSFRMQLMLHGLRHTHQYAIEAIERLESGEELRVAVELNNPVTKRAILVYTKDYHVLGWLPRYIAEGLYRGCDWRLPEVEATVVQVNRNAPLSNRLLLDFSGRLPPGVNPMRDLVQFQPIAGADEDETA